MKNWLTVFLIVVLLAFYHDGYSQREQKNVLRALVENGDTTAIVDLEPVTVFSPLEFENEEEKEEFYRIAYHVKKVYPYARLAGIEFEKVKSKLDSADNFRERRKIVKKVEEKIKSRHKEELKELKFKQGRILIKLIDRETSHTSYRILENMRGRLIAGFWQSLGKVFGYDLKKGYDPENNEFDRKIETIVQMIEAGSM